MIPLLKNSASEGILLMISSIIENCCRANEVHVARVRLRRYIHCIIQKGGFHLMLLVLFLDYSEDNMHKFLRIQLFEVPLVTYVDLTFLN